MTAEDEAAMRQGYEEYQKIEKEIEQLNAIKERMGTLTKGELNVIQGMSREGYEVYRNLQSEILQIGGEPAKAAKMNALLIARHAEVAAAAMRRRGYKNYTAMDYYRDNLSVVGEDTEAPKRGAMEQAEINRQKEEVRKKYEGTDRWMKAPNGEQTNLTEDQWITVRTEAFKNWFGDWENDPENASKVVDENGEPLVVYHGTDAEFDTFESANDSYFFSESTDYAEAMAEERNGYKIYDVFLNIKNPLVIELPENRFSDPAAERKYIKQAKEQGNDGTFFKNNPSDELFADTFYVAFEPTQIKSATDNNGQFDAGDPNIYHQFAGNVDNPGENVQNKSAETVGAGVVVKGDEFGQYKDIKELRAKAVQYYSKNLQGTSVENKVLGKIDIDENGIVNFTGSGKREMKGTSAKTNKLLLVKYLPQLIAGATNITSSEAEKKRHANETFYYLHTSATIDGDNVPVEITLVKRNDGSIQYYNHILPAEENNKNTSVSPGPESSREALGTPAVDVSFGNPNIPRGGGNVNENRIAHRQAKAALIIRAAFLMGKNRRNLKLFSVKTRCKTIFIRVFVRRMKSRTLRKFFRKIPSRG